MFKQTLFPQFQANSIYLVTFSKIVKQFQKRPALSPEQDVSLSIFKMSRADHQLRLTKLNSDETELYQTLTAVTGIAKGFISKNVPPLKQTLPPVENAPFN